MKLLNSFFGKLLVVGMVLASLFMFSISASAAPHRASASDPFIFATFDGDAASEQELWIYTSTDGSNWSLLADTNFKGPTGTLRDPSIIKNPADGKYYVAYTVFSYTTQSTYFNIASSSNLINWTHVTSVNANVAGTQFTWAPEFFVEGSTIKIITSLSPSNSPWAFKPYIYTALNSSLTSWSGGVAMGIPTNKIDTFVVKSGSTYHAFTQNGDTLYIEHATASSLTGPWTYIATGNWAGWGSGKEGPALFQLDNGTWTLFADWYSTNGIYKATSTNLTTWSSPLTSVSSLSSKRHGTVLKQGVGGPTPTPGTYYRLTNRNSSKVADVQNPNTSDGAKVGQWAWSGANWQQWQFVDVGSGYFNIISRNSGKCLDVISQSTADGAGIDQWTCNGGQNQQFQWAATGSYFNIKARHSGKCINVVGGALTDGALLEQRTCGTGNSFQWTRQ
jgi:hypothetical protein